MLIRRLFLLLSFAFVGLLQAADAPQVIYLWPAGSPTLKGADEKEITTPENVKPGDRINSIKNVHNPSIEVYLPPADKAVGTAVIVAPGGGPRQPLIRSPGSGNSRRLDDLGGAAGVF